MSTITLPFTLANNTVADASEVNSNFTTIVNDYNGSVANANISGSAAINESKILFAAAGHDHSGTTSGNRVRAQRALVTFTHDLTTASGTLTVTGAGFTPTFVRLVYFVPTAAGRAGFGFDDGTVSFGMFDADVTTDDTWDYTASYAIYVDQGVASYYQMKVSSFNSDGCVLTTVKTGSPTGTLRVLAIFER